MPGAGDGTFATSGVPRGARRLSEHRCSAAPTELAAPAAQSMFISPRVKADGPTAIVRWCPDATV